MKRILLTGASGFIGRQCVPFLESCGFQVHGVSQAPSREAPAGVRWHHRNLLEDGSARELIASIKPSHLLHLAWIATPGVYWHSPDNDPWADASLALARAFFEAGGKRAVFAGTCAEYDWSAGECTEGASPLAEGSEETPLPPYVDAKQRLARELDELEIDGSLAWARVFFTYGPHEHPDKLVASIIRALLEGRVAETSEGEQRRDFMHVMDIAGALVATLESSVEGPVNIGTGQAPRVKDIAQAIAELIGRTDLLALGARPSSSDEAPLVLADTRRLSSEVGYRPSYDLRSGLGHTIEWWRVRMREQGNSGGGDAS